jgi:hypothetical protein
MSANIHGQMVYSFEKPMWHNITEPSLEPLTAEQVYDMRFGGGFEIELRPITVKLNGKRTETNRFGIVRTSSPYDPEERLLDVCTERYRPLQPRQVAQIFDANVCEPAETMAFLGHGEDMFISWAMPEYDVRDGDGVKMYGIIRTGFTTKDGTRLFVACVRPVCWNTITMAEGWAKQNTNKEANRGIIWKGKGVNRNLARDLGYWTQHVQTKALVEAELLQSFFAKLTQQPVKNDEHAQKILTTAYPNHVDNSAHGPWQLRDEVSAKVADYNNGQEEIRSGIKNLFDGAGTEITPDFWGMLNATTEYFCHVQPSKKPIAESVMFGPRAQKTMAMVETLNKLTLAKS